MIPILLVTVIVAVAQGGANLSRLQIFRTLNQVNVGPQNSGSRIVGGELCPDCQWMASLEISMYDGRRRYCGGTIIRPMWIVTAANCFNETNKPQDVKIKVGSLKPTLGKQCKAKEIIIHEKYSHLPFDIALIRLSENITFDDNIKPLTLVKEPLSVGSKLYVSGRGKTEASSTKLAEQYMHADTLLTQCPENIQTMICTYKLEMSVCTGDMGGPLYNAETLELVGVISRTAKKDCKGHGFYSDVFSLSDWIESKIRISEQNKDPETTEKPTTTTTPTTLTTPWKPITPVGSASSYYRPVLVCWLVTLLHSLHLFYIRWC